MQKLGTANNQSNLQSKKKASNARNLELKQSRSKKENTLRKKRQDMKTASSSDSVHESEILDSAEETQAEVTLIKLLNIE